MQKVAVSDVIMCIRTHLRVGGPAGSDEERKVADESDANDRTQTEK